MLSQISIDVMMPYSGESLVFLAIRLLTYLLRIIPNASVIELLGSTKTTRSFIQSRTVFAISVLLEWLSLIWYSKCSVRYDFRQSIVGQIQYSIRETNDNLLKINLITRLGRAKDHCKAFQSQPRMVSRQRYAVRSSCSGQMETKFPANAPMSVPSSGTPVGASPPIQ